VLFFRANNTKISPEAALKRIFLLQDITRHNISQQTKNLLRCCVWKPSVIIRTFRSSTNEFQLCKLIYEQRDANLVSTNTVQTGFTILKMSAFWDIAPWGFVEGYRRFRGAYSLHHQSDGQLLRDYTAPYCRRLSSSYSPWKPEILLGFKIIFMLKFRPHLVASR
jgi:hypothetical protein